MTPVTVVVGAGPAGLLTTLVSRLRWRAGGHDPDSWQVVLVDKRSEYVRTHRLRIDPEPFAGIATSLASPEFDRFMAFLTDVGFRPDVARLEQVLSELVTSLGIRRELMEVGLGAGARDIASIRRHLLESKVMESGFPMTIVGADSVHSSVREMVADDQAGVQQLHSVVTRLHVTGPELPDHLGALTQFKLAKALGSALDYRSHPDGHAEVDLFLDESEQAAVEALDAGPTNRVTITEATITEARLFSAVVGSLRSELGEGRNDVVVHSTFRLEHRYQPQVVFHIDELTTVLFPSFLSWHGVVGPVRRRAVKRVWSAGQPRVRKTTPIAPCPTSTATKGRSRPSGQPRSSEWNGGRVPSAGCARS